MNAFDNNEMDCKGIDVEIRNCALSSITTRSFSYLKNLFLYKYQGNNK